MSKLSKVQVIVIGSVATIIVGVGMFFLLIRPKMEQLDQLQTELESRQQVAARLESARADLEAARLESLQARLDYRRYEDEKMPVITFADRTTGMIALWREHSEVLGPMIEKWPRRFGVELQNTISIPPATVNPNQLTNNMIEIPIGSITVRGDYQSILRHIEGWNDFNRLVRVDPFSIQGISPALEATYNLTVMFFPRGEIGPTVPIAAGGETDTGMPGMPAMPGPAMPGPMPGAPGPPPGADAPPPPMP